MITFEGVGKAYEPAPLPGRAKPVTALSGVSLTIPRGATWAVVGPNGAGKTTLFGLLLGFLHPTEGRVRIAGLEPRTYLRRHGAAFLPERLRLPSEWTVSATLRSLAELEGLSAREARARADAAMERLGLGPHAAKRLGVLSRGLLQRVGLAQALLADRELVVLDEPTEGLDPLWRIRFRALADELRSEGRTVLIASHDLAEVERIAERAVLLESGKVREILEIGGPTGPGQRYRLELASPSEILHEVFPGATAEADGESTAYVITVADAGELSARLAVLLDAGAVLASVAPVIEPLEERVQRVLSGGAQ